ncbi:hypothetical protein ACTXKF_17050, partial [Vreelandella alkaliphila]
DAFLPENLEKHEAWVRELVRSYMDHFIDKGRADLVGEISRWSSTLIHGPRFLKKIVRPLKTCREKDSLACLAT